MSEKILITAALPYANGPLHFGHIAGAYLPADCYARFQRLQQNDVLYICGSDEHGVAITLSADVAGRTPKEHVDIFHKINKDFFSQLGISFDHYSRTTWPGHVHTTQQFFKDLLENGYIEAKVTDQLYSENEKRFLADRYVIGTCPKCKYDKARGDECPRCGSSYEATDLIAPRSKISNSPLILKPTKHWFLRFDLFKNQLATWLQSKDWKANVIAFAKSYVDDLKPRAITRDSDWGIPVPLKEAEGKVFYVWFDAPIGYISATQEWAEKKGDKNLWKEYWFDPATKLVQFVGKDNIPFHAVFFPAMTMGQNEPYKLVDELPANEFLNLEGRQFSKSEGWTIDLESFFTNFTADQIRYTLAANAPENQDSEFSWKDFQMRCNVELLGKLGNFVNRTLVFASQHCGSLVPALREQKEEDKQFLEKILYLAEECRRSFETFHLRKAAQLLMEVASAGNAYFDHKKPWVLAKNPETKTQMTDAIAACIECIKVLSLLSLPIIPESAEKIWRLIGFTTPLDAQNWQQVLNTQVPTGQKLPQTEILFKRVEDELIQKELDKLGKLMQKNETTPSTDQISIDEFKKVDLRVATIVSLERVPNTKLLKLLVDLGTEKRTILTSLDESRPNAHLVGKKVIVIANLKPAKIRGIESQGLVLTAITSDTHEFPELQNTPAGTRIS